MGGVGQNWHKTHAGMKVKVLIEWFGPLCSSCSGWKVLTLPNEVLERHGAAVEEQAGTECKIDTGGGGGEEELGGGGGGGGGGREGEEVELWGRYQCERRGYRIFHYGLQPAGNHSLWNLRFDAVFKKKIRFGPWGILRTKLRAWGWCWWWWRRGRRQGGPRAVRADGGWGVCADRLYEACAGFPVKSSVTDRVSTWISCWNSQPWRWSQKYSFTINYRLIKLSKYIFHNFQESW